MLISDERLADLALDAATEAKKLRDKANRINQLGEPAKAFEDIAATLRELQQRRANECIHTLAMPTRFVPGPSLNRSPDILSKCGECGAFLGHDHVCLY